MYQFCDESLTPSCFFSVNEAFKRCVGRRVGGVNAGDEFTRQTVETETQSLLYSNRSTEGDHEKKLFLKE